MKIFGLKINVLLLFTVLFGGAAPLWAQGTAFTYQGRLNTSNGPATGVYDFQFTVKDALTGGSGVGVFPLSTTLPVTNGLFTVTLDPGAGVFTGLPRWLEIAVRTNGAASYTNLSPRQLLTATPYAIRATGAAVASSVTPGAVTAAGLAPGAVFEVGNPSGSISNAIQVDAGGLVGVGTNAPRAGLDVVRGSTIVAPFLQFELRDETGGYTNLASANSVAVSGNLLAVGGGGDNGITLLDISDPKSPVLQAQFRDGDPGFTNLLFVNAVAMKTNLLVVAGTGTKAITFISLTNPASPVKLAEVVDGVGGWNELDGIFGLAIRGNLLAIAAVNDNAVTLADISNPAAPIKRVEMKDGVFGFNSLSGAVSVAISGNLLAIGAFYDSAVTLVDITDPSNPIKLSELRDGFGGFNNLSNVYKVALSTNGLLAISGALDDTVTLVDVSNPASPVKLAEITDGVNGIDSLLTPTGLDFSGNRLAVVGAGDGAVTVFDISNPSVPRPLAVMRDGVGGFDFISSAAAVVWAGTNLVVPSNDDAVTMIGFSTATAGIASQGRVGIGTAQPRAALDVVGDVIVDNAVLFDVNANRIELGIGSTANGTNSVAIGKDALATGLSSLALGNGAKASGDYSTALGISTKASGLYSFAAGNSTVASGNYSVALGGFSTASGDYSFAMGPSATASGYESVAFGENVLAAGTGAFALGNSTTATNFAFAAGTQAKALHDGSFVWADKSFIDFNSTSNNQFLIRASGGVAINTNNPSGVALNVAGTVAATNFVGRFTGNGGGLTNAGPTVANYVFAYDTTVQAVLVAGTFQDVTFNNNAQLSGWVHIPGGQNFVSGQTGLYLVEYSAQTDTLAAGLSTVSIKALLNGVEISGSQSSTDPDTATQTFPLSKSFIVSAAAGSTLKLQFTGTTTNNRLAGNGAGTITPALSMTIVRIQ